MGILDSAPKVENCCFCIDLPTGAKLIALCQLIGWILIGTSVINGFAYSHEVIDTETNFDADDKQAITAIAHTLLAAQFIFCVLGICISICLLVGVIQLNPKLVKIWLYVELVSFLFSLPGTIYGLAGQPPRVTLLKLAFISLRVYWWLSVNTLHSKLLRPEGSVAYVLPSGQAQVNVLGPGEVYVAPMHLGVSPHHYIQPPKSDDPPPYASVYPNLQNPAASSVNPSHSLMVYRPNNRSFRWMKCEVFK